MKNQQKQSHILCVQTWLINFILKNKIELSANDTVFDGTSAGLTLSTWWRTHLDGPNDLLSKTVVFKKQTPSTIFILTSRWFLSMLSAFNQQHRLLEPNKTSRCFTWIFWSKLRVYRCVKFCFGVFASSWRMCYKWSTLQIAVDFKHFMRILSYFSLHGLEHKTRFGWMEKPSKIWTARALREWQSSEFVDKENTFQINKIPV